MLSSMRADAVNFSSRTRRSFVGGLVSAALCPLAARTARAMAGPLAEKMAAMPTKPAMTRAAYNAGTGHYGPILSEPFPVPAVNLSQIDPAFLMKAVPYAGNEAPGTIVINPSSRYLYLVQEGGGRCATASASDARVSAGRASPTIKTSRNGPIGTRPRR